MHLRLIGIVCALGTAVTTTAALAEKAGPACRLEPAGTGTVRAVADGRILTLADGREVRLAGIEAPLAGPAAAAAAAALTALVAGREVILKGVGTPAADRHGRLMAFVFAAPNAPSAQHALLAQGHARVAANVGDFACAVSLLAAERAARRGGLGLWGDPYYVMRRAELPAEVLAERGRFTLVEGKVQSVRESGATIYVNFGRRWSEDFTVTVSKRRERTFATAGLELTKLTGRNVRVRGFVEERGGPWIEAARPEQIEVAD